jgi:UDP-2,4-diacetamido-2,4,6-trideoxy-beta-L-altropyranose hydrolase
VSTPCYRVALRADASPLAGFGHVKRCIALALALREIGAEVRLVSRALGIDTCTIAHEAKIEQCTLPAPTDVLPPPDTVPYAAWARVGWEQDAAQTIKELANWRPDCVVVDHYAFDARWHRMVASALDTRIAAIDDLADRALDAHLVIDQNPHQNHRDKYRQWIDSNAKVLGGPRFAMLSPAYAVPQALRIGDEVRSIGIFMGGVDASDLTSLALRACREHANFTGPIEIVATRAYSHLTALIKLVRQWPETEILRDLPDLADFFSRHDMQIGAGGGAAWERCCAGVPTLALIGAANQRAVIPPLAELGVVATIEADLPTTAKNAGRVISALLSDPIRRRALAERGRSLVDGFGATRVALTLTADLLALRDAQLDDAKQAFYWRNHPATRQFSRNSRVLRLAEHCDWWQRTLLLPERRLFIAHVGRYDVGVLRLDLEGDAAEISIYLDPILTGLGLGHALLRAAQSWVLENQSLMLKRLVAEIMPDNRVSQNAFTQARFALKGTRWIWDVPR